MTMYGTTLAVLNWFSDIRMYKLVKNRNSIQPKATCKSLLM